MARISPLAASRTTKAAWKESAGSSGYLPRRTARTRSVPACRAVSAACCSSRFREVITTGAPPSGAGTGAGWAAR